MSCIDSGVYILWDWCKDTLTGSFCNIREYSFWNSSDFATFLPSIISLVTLAACHPLGNAHRFYLLFIPCTLWFILEGALLLEKGGDEGERVHDYDNCPGED